MQRINYARRKARGGKGLIPPNKVQWDPEHRGLDLRLALELPLDVSLDPVRAFELLEDVTVRGHGDIPAAHIYLDHFRLQGSGNWSGMALKLPDGHELVFYNDAHAETRVRATLMEEFFHILLDHPRSALRIIGNGQEPVRTHDSSVEFEAYSCGAAALVPYRSLRTAIERGHTREEIARRFGVSPALVDFRLKVTKLWGQYRRRAK